MSRISSVGSRSFFGFILSLSIVSPVTIASPVVAASTAGLVELSSARDTRLTLYADKGLVNQTMDVALDKQGRVELSGISNQWLQDSIGLRFSDGNQWFAVKQLHWKPGGLERDRLYRRLVGKQVELVGGGLHVAVQGTLLSYDNGLALVKGVNGRQYLLDWNDPQGIRPVAKDDVFVSNNLQPALIGGFGKPDVQGSLQLSYISPELSFKNQYRLTLEEGQPARLSLDSLLRNNSPVNYSTADIQLVSGGTGNAGYGESQQYQRVQMVMSADTSSEPQRQGEIMVTAVPAGTLLEPYSRAQVSLYSNDRLNYQKVYQYDIYARSFQGGQTLKEKPGLSYRFKAERDLPEGNIRIYETLDNGHSLVTGESFLPRTLKGDTVLVSAGQALAVRLQRTLLSQQHQSGQVSNDWKIEVENDNPETAMLLLVVRDYSLIELTEIEGARMENRNTLVVTISAGKKQVVSFKSKFSK